MRYLLRDVIDGSLSVGVGRRLIVDLNVANLQVEITQALTLRIRHGVTDADDAAVGRTHAARTAYGADASGAVKRNARLTRLAGRRFCCRVAKPRRCVSGRTLGTASGGLFRYGC